MPMSWKNPTSCKRTVQNTILLKTYMIYLGTVGKWTGNSPVPILYLPFYYLICVSVHACNLWQYVSSLPVMNSALTVLIRNEILHTCMYAHYPITMMVCMCVLYNSSSLKLKLIITMMKCITTATHVYIHYND